MERESGHKSTASLRRGRFAILPGLRRRGWTRERSIEGGMCNSRCKELTSQTATVRLAVAGAGLQLGLEPYPTSAGIKPGPQRPIHHAQAANHHAAMHGKIRPLGSASRSTMGLRSRPASLLRDRWERPPDATRRASYAWPSGRRGCRPQALGLRSGRLFRVIPQAQSEQHRPHLPQIPQSFQPMTVTWSYRTSRP